MAILFFDGFDRCTITKNFDQNYWSFQPFLPVEYKKYAFGGYSYDHASIAYGEPDSEFYYGYYGYSSTNIMGTGYYSHYAINNATAPTGIYITGQAILSSMIDRYAGNSYPGFGSPPGFIALNNLDISDNNLLAPISYVQLSGFNTPQSGESFLSCRMLGIETKDENYHESDLNGRFGHRHPLVAFCSGNITGLLINVIKVTGNHITEIENEKMTIGLEVMQNNEASGTFDMNVGNNINNFRIRSLYTREAGYTSGEIGGRILCIDVNNNTLSEPIRDYNQNLIGPISPISRWSHLQFGIIQTGSSPYPMLKIKFENIDLHAIPEDDTIPDEGSNWNDYISISGFDFDNIRFFNRTYNGSISFGEHEDPAIHRYYMLGAVTLLDDVILSDASGTPSTYLGSSARVIPFSPGVSGNIDNSGSYPDGLSEWEASASGNRLMFKNLDGDQNKFSSSTSGQITAVRYTNSNYRGPDNNSDFRFTSEDSIGGMKFYSQAKKEFLDTRYEVVIKTGEQEQEDSYMSIGGIQNLTRTRYGSVYQFYEYNNPFNNQPWNTGVIASPSGFILGVKKL